MTNMEDVLKENIEEAMDSMEIEKTNSNTKRYEKMKFIETLKTIFVTIKDLVVLLVNLAIPVGIGLIACDILIGTKIGVLQRAVDLVKSLGLTQNAITIFVIIATSMWLLSWYERIKK